MYSERYHFEFSGRRYGMTKGEEMGYHIILAEQALERKYGKDGGKTVGTPEFRELQVLIGQAWLVLQDEGKFYGETHKYVLKNKDKVKEE